LIWLRKSLSLSFLFVPRYNQSHPKYHQNIIDHGRDVEDQNATFVDEMMMKKMMK
jgi:hypothetical protein